MVCFRAQGRLGNVMLEYAAASGVSHDICAYIGEQWSGDCLRANEVLFGSVRIVEKPDWNCWKESRFSYVPIKKGSDDLIIEGTFFSEKYFDKDFVKLRFAPSESARQYLYEKYGEWLSRPNVSGISVRRGDYMHQQHEFPFVGKNYFEACLSRLSEVKDFIVCSDDIAWCQKYFPTKYPDRYFLFVEGESALNQIYIHALCKNNIISNSSFSWWGAWLNENPNKRVLAPSMWFGFAISKRIDARDVYAEGTEIIKNRYDFVDGVCAAVTFVNNKVRRALRPCFYPVYKKLRRR